MRRVAIFGVANDRSLCWAIAQRMLADKADVVLVSHPMMLERVRKLAHPFGIEHVYGCEVGDPESIYERPSHPYTAALLAAIPEPDPSQRPD